MRSAASKTKHKLQLDLPLGEPDSDSSNSIRSLSSTVSAEAINSVTESFVTAHDPGHLDRPVPFPIGPEPVVETHAEQAPRETKLPVGTATNPDRRLGAGDLHAPRASRNLTDSSTGIDQDAAPSGHQISLSAWVRLLPLLRELRRAAEDGPSVDRPLDRRDQVGGHRHREHEHGERPHP